MGKPMGAGTGPTSHVPTVLAEVAGRMPLTMPFFSGPLALLKPGGRGEGEGGAMVE